MAYLLDTRIASAVLKGNAALDQRLQHIAPENWAISAITRAELRHGVALRPDASRLAQVVEAFLALVRAAQAAFTAAKAPK